MILLAYIVCVRLTNANGTFYTSLRISSRMGRCRLVGVTMRVAKQI